MAKGSKPKAGSRAFWPRKRAKRMYPTKKPSSELKGDVKPMTFAAYKAGMTRVVYEGSTKNSPLLGKDIAKAVTVLDCPPMFVCGAKLYKKNDEKEKDIAMLWAEKLDKGLSRKIKLPAKYDFKKKLGEVEKSLTEADDVRLVVNTQPTKGGVGKKTPEIFEVTLSGKKDDKWAYAKENLGKEIKVDNVFDEGEFIDTSSITKGKGFQGPVKRFGVTIRERKSHGKRRHIGNIGAVTPGRVFPGKIAMAGQHGFQCRTEYNKRIMKIASEGFSIDGAIVNYGSVPGQYLLLEGSVGGPKKRLIIMRKSNSHPERKEPAEIKYVETVSQQ